MTDDNYQFVRISDATLGDLARLMDSVYGSETDLSALRAKYDTRELGGQYLGYLAYAKNETSAAAYYGVFPCRLAIDGKIYLGSQSGDTMTHADHRGKGLFAKLARLTYTLAQSEGIACVFGFPNPASYPGFIKNLEWKHAYDMVAINIVTPTLPLNLAARRSTRLAGWQKRAFEWAAHVLFRQADDAVASSVMFDKAAGVARDTEFLKYKKGSGLFLQCGQARMFVKYDGDICIGDLIDLSGGPDGRAAIRKLRFLGVLTGLPRIKCYASPESRLCTILRGAGFSRTSLAYGWRDFSTGLDLSKLQFTYFDYDTF